LKFIYGVDITVNIETYSKMTEISLITALGTVRILRCQRCVRGFFGLADRSAQHHHFVSA
jgi:hypothetical protein